MAAIANRRHYWATAAIAAVVLVIIGTSARVSAHSNPNLQIHGISIGDSMAELKHKIGEPSKVIEGNGRKGLSFDHVPDLRVWLNPGGQVDEVWGNELEKDGTIILHQGETQEKAFHLLGDQYSVSNGTIFFSKLSLYLQTRDERLVMFALIQANGDHTEK